MSENIYFSASNQGFYHSNVQNKLPQDIIEITREQYFQIYNKLSSGFKALVTDGVFVFEEQTIQLNNEDVENNWVRNELDRIRNELEKVQDSDPTAIGSVSDWRIYRKAVRTWSENINFPDKNYRPVSPEVQE